jgi:CDP-diglyceride synthetase
MPSNVAIGRYLLMGSGYFNFIPKFTSTPTTTFYNLAIGITSHTTTGISYVFMSPATGSVTSSNVTSIFWADPSNLYSPQSDSSFSYPFTLQAYVTVTDSTNSFQINATASGSGNTNLPTNAGLISYANAYYIRIA